MMLCNDTVEFNVLLVFLSAAATDIKLSTKLLSVVQKKKTVVITH